LSSDITSGNASAPKGKSRQGLSIFLGAACALVIGIVLWFVDPASALAPDSPAKEAPYNLLVQGFRAGQLNLDVPPPPGLAKLSNPFNPDIVARDMGRIADMSYYKGKVYMYFGVTPAVVLYWPYLIVTGHYLSDKAAVIIFFTSGFLIAAAILYDLRQRYLSNTSIVMATLAMFTLVLALTLILWCNFNQVAMSCGFAFSMAALWGIWHALHEPKQRLWWVLLASLAYGLAVGARPSLLFGGLILLLPAAQAWRWSSWQKAGGLLAAAAGPAMLVGLGLMIYNYQRFDNPFEFGWHYQLNQGYDPTTARQFSLHFLWFNFHFYFLEPLRWSGHFPFLQSIPQHSVPPGYMTHTGDPNAGLFANYPFIVLALAVPLVWRGRPEAEAWVLRWFMGAIFLLFGLIALTLCLFMGATDRYELDFLPALVMLAVVGVLGLERALVLFPVWRRVARGGVGLLVGYSLVYNVLESIEIHTNVDCLTGNILLAQGHLDEASVQYQKALSRWPDSPDANAGAGSVSFQKGQIDEAIVHYQKALEINPDVAETHNNLGYCFLQKGHADEAIIQFQKAVELYPDSAVFHNALGNAFFNKGDIPAAIIQYKKALELNPDFAETYNNLGYCLLQEGRVDDAIIQYQNAVRIQPGSESFHNALANAFVQKGQLDQAIFQYKKALEIKPDFAEARYNLGYCLLQTGRVDDAIIQFQKAVELQPQFAQAYKSLGDAFSREGVPAQADAAWKKAAELSAGSSKPNK
jgi:tetratricopeptide (TPR) repeat protein